MSGFIVFPRKPWRRVVSENTSVIEVPAYSPGSGNDPSPLMAVVFGKRPDMRGRTKVFRWPGLYHSQACFKFEGA